MSTFWSLHTHTRESTNDALPSIARTVARAKELGYPALGITDHGTISGAVEFYKECRKADIKPLIGVEAYIAIDRTIPTRSTMHACLVAYTEEGYRNLCRLSTMANENHYYKPVLDLADLAQAYSEGRLAGILMTSGCWFGLLPTVMRTGYLGQLSNMVKALDRWFDGMFFIEIQNHQISDETHDDDAHARLLHMFAVSMNLPTVITQDSHYLYPADQATHDAFKTLTSWNTEDLDSAVFPGDGYHMVDTEWMVDHHPPDIFARGMAGLDTILAKAELVIPELEHYELKVPDTTLSGDADSELAHWVADTLLMRVTHKTIPKSRLVEYQARLAEELDVITTSGFSGYLMLAKTLTDWMREQDIEFRVRGSATGSLVCWLLNVTGYDPIKWNLSFDRFLSRDRTKPPDIDFDIEHLRRKEAVEWLSERFYTVQISTAAGYKIHGEDEENATGSLAITFKQRQRKLGMDPLSPIPAKWYRNLQRIAEFNGRMPDGTPIDPPLKSVGQHPAGVLVAPDAETLALIPKRYVASSKTMVSAFDMNDVEALGLVKLDMLGQRTLTAVRIAEEIAGVRCEEFPLNDTKVYSRIGRGWTEGVFQLEGFTATFGVKRMKPKTIHDVIAAVALFRPATRKSGATDSYLHRRAGDEEVPVRHPLIMAHTTNTYGVLVYQEQALNIMKDLGLSVEEVERARKAIKASNANVGNAAQLLSDMMAHISELARGHGMNDEDIDWLINTLNAYAGYSFNLAHATAYGILAYQTAYLAVHHKVAFWTGALVSSEGEPAPSKREMKPEDVYIKAARRDNVIIRPPHINRSDLSYTTDGTEIYRGLTSIKGVGQSAAEELVEHQPYPSLEHLARAVAPRRVTGVKDLGKGHSPEACPGTVHALFDAGALHGIPMKLEPETNE